MLLILFGFLIVIGVIILLSVLAPKNYNICRSIIIDKPVSGVFQYLKYLKNQDHWSPWKKKDLTMKQEFIGTDGEVGFIAKWSGNSDVGEGKQEITAIVENKRIDAELRFYKPWKSTSKAFTIVEDLGKMQTKVTWGFSGENKFPSNIFMLFFNMEKSVGKDFEEGLSNLKKLLEKQ
jgi:hypothetical protein